MNTLRAALLALVGLTLASLTNISIAETPLGAAITNAGIPGSFYHSNDVNPAFPANARAAWERQTPDTPEIASTQTDGALVAEEAAFPEDVLFNDPLTSTTDETFGSDGAAAQPSSGGWQHDGGFGFEVMGGAGYRANLNLEDFQDSIEDLGDTNSTLGPQNIPELFSKAERSVNILDDNYLLLDGGVRVGLEFATKSGASWSLDVQNHSGVVTYFNSAPINVASNATYGEEGNKKPIFGASTVNGKNCFEEIKTTGSVGNENETTACQQDIENFLRAVADEINIEDIENIDPNDPNIPTDYVGSPGCDPIKEEYEQCFTLETDSNLEIDLASAMVYRLNYANSAAFGASEQWLVAYGVRPKMVSVEVNKATITVGGENDDLEAYTDQLENGFVSITGFDADAGISLRHARWALLGLSVDNLLGSKLEKDGKTYALDQQWHLQTALYPLSWLVLGYQMDLGEAAVIGSAKEQWNTLSVNINPRSRWWPRLRASRRTEEVSAMQYTGLGATLLGVHADILFSDETSGADDIPNSIYGSVGFGFGW